jgi:hypothetical protein
VLIAHSGKERLAIVIRIVIQMIKTFLALALIAKMLLTTLASTIIVVSKKRCGIYPQADA